MPKAFPVFVCTMPPHIQENVPLAKFTTLRIGGAARYFVTVESEAHITEAFKFAEDNGLDILVLVGVSNILVADSGFDGLVLKLNIKGVDVSTPDENGFVSVRGGAG